jgi:hypothetical protein
MSRIKEPYHFDPRAQGVLDEAVVCKDQYMALFRFAPFNARLIGEGSTTYASSPEALRRINEFSPQARVLMILRNPLEASLSLYLQHLRGGSMKGPQASSRHGRSAVTIVSGRSSRITAAYTELVTS